MSTGGNYFKSTGSYNHDDDAVGKSLCFKCKASGDCVYTDTRKRKGAWFKPTVMCSRFMRC